MTRIKTGLFAILPCLLLFLALDFAARHLYGESLAALAGDILTRRAAQERVVFRSPLAEADSVTGYACIPGEHRISLVKGLARVDFDATIGPDGYRITTRSPLRDRRPQIWISGCSFTWGLGVNDDETYPWLVQKALPDLRVRNLGGNGFGNVQALVQLREAVRLKAELPRIMVVVYNDFDLPRNVAAPSYLSMMNGSASAFGHGNIATVRASLDAGGGLSVGFEPLFRPIGTDAVDPSRAYETAVAEKILDGIYEICMQNAITPVFAIQSRPAGDPILKYAAGTNWVTADLWIDLDERAGTRYRLMPVDPHPNKLAHQAYAANLLGAIRKL
jgi:hypothetical protein